MKTTFKWLIPIVLLVVLTTVVAMPAMAQGPVTVHHRLMSKRRTGIMA